MRVAAVDLGTNSTRLLVADVNGTLDEIVRRLEITRLGEGVDERRRLLPVPIARVRNVLSDYRRELEALGAERTLCIATSAVRDAENGEAFLGEIEWSYGFTTRMLSGDEEAQLTLRGIGALEPGTLVVDIGGGSTEVQVVGGDVRESLDVGCVRMTERFGEDVSAIREHVRGLLPRARPERAVGVAGTVTTIAALDLGLTEYDPERIHGHSISRAAVAEQTARLASMTVEERAEIIEPGPGAGDRRRRGDSVRGARRLRPRCDRGERAGHPPRGCTRRGRAARARRGCGTARRLHLLLGLVLGRRLVLGQPSLQHRAREHADEPSVLEDGHPLEVLLLEKTERLVERELGADRVQRHLDDLPQAASCADRGRRRRSRARASSASRRRGSAPRR